MMSDNVTSDCENLDYQLSYLGVRDDTSTSITSSISESDYSDNESCKDSNEINNLDFTVTLLRKSDKSVTELNYSAFWGTEEYKKTEELLSKFKKLQRRVKIYDFDGCQYYVTNIQFN